MNNNNTHFFFSEPRGYPDKMRWKVTMFMVEKSGAKDFEWVRGDIKDVLKILKIKGIKDNNGHFVLSFRIISDVKI